MNDRDDTVDSIVISQASEWFVTHRSGPLTESQREAFIDWLRASPAHTREYLALSGFTEDFSQVAANCALSQAALVANARMDGASVVSSLPVKRLRSAPRRSLFISVATAAAVLVAVLAAVWKPTDPSYITAHTEQRSWRLPDGSTVHLNSSSRIKLHFSADRRQVELTAGQAIFQVAKDPARPFVVEAGDARVRALGTQFDVRLKSGATIVSVMEGRVAVQRANEARDIELTSGEQAKVGAARMTVAKADVEVRKAVAWLQRQVVFEHDPLAEVAEEFNRYNDVHIRVADPALRREEVSGIFSAYDTESFVQFLQRQPSMRVERRGGELWVTPAPASH